MFTPLKRYPHALVTKGLQEQNPAILHKYLLANPEKLVKYSHNKQPLSLTVHSLARPLAHCYQMIRQCLFRAPTWQALALMGFIHYQTQTVFTISNISPQQYGQRIQDYYRTHNRVIPHIVYCTLQIKYQETLKLNGKLVPKTLLRMGYFGVFNVNDRALLIDHIPIYINYLIERIKALRDSLDPYQLLIQIEGFLSKNSFCGSYFFSTFVLQLLHQHYKQVNLSSHQQLRMASIIYMVSRQQQRFYFLMKKAEILLARITLPIEIQSCLDQAVTEYSQHHPTLKWFNPLPEKGTMLHQIYENRQKQQLKIRRKLRIVLVTKLMRVLMMKVNFLSSDILKLCPILQTELQFILQNICFSTLFFCLYQISRTIQQLRPLVGQLQKHFNKRIEQLKNEPQNLPYQLFTPHSHEQFLSVTCPLLKMNIQHMICDKTLDECLKNNPFFLTNLMTEGFHRFMYDELKPAVHQTDTWDYPRHYDLYLELKTKKLRFVFSSYIDSFMFKTQYPLAHNEHLIRLDCTQFEKCKEFIQQQKVK